MSDEERRHEQQPPEQPPPPPPPGGAGAPSPPPYGRQPGAGPQASPQTGPYGYQPYQAGDVYRAGPSGPRATFGQRLVAAIIDGLIVGVPLWLLSVILGASLTLNIEVNENTGELTGTEVGAGAGVILLYILISIVVTVGYFAYFEGGDSGQTIGKRAMGIRVLRADGGPLGWGLAVGRFFARYLSAAICYIGYLWMLWDREKQTWHDKLCNTFVVPTSAYPVVPRT